METPTNLIPTNFRTWTRQMRDCNPGEQRARVFVAARDDQKTALAGVVIRDPDGTLRGTDTATLPEQFSLSLEKTGIMLISHILSYFRSTRTAVAAGSPCIL